MRKGIIYSGCTINCLDWGTIEQGFCIVCEFFFFFFMFLSTFKI